jgi:hypothetical protein
MKSGEKAPWGSWAPKRRSSESILRRRPGVYRPTAVAPWARMSWARRPRKATSSWRSCSSRRIFSAEM